MRGRRSVFRSLLLWSYFSMLRSSSRSEIHHTSTSVFVSLISALGKGSGAGLTGSLVLLRGWLSGMGQGSGFFGSGCASELRSTFRTGSHSHHLLVTTAIRFIGSRWERGDGKLS